MMINTRQVHYYHRAGWYTSEDDRRQEWDLSALWSRDPPNFIQLPKWRLHAARKTNLNHINKFRSYSSTSRNLWSSPWKSYKSMASWSLLPTFPSTLLIKLFRGHPTWKPSSPTSLLQKTWWRRMPFWSKISNVWLLTDRRKIWLS